MTTVYDVAVIGGGVAGAAACIALARGGRRPIWLAPSGREPAEPFGESLSPAAGSILEQLGLRALLDAPVHRRSNAVFSSWGGPLVERSAMFDPGGAGWVLDRRGFELGLRGAAHECAEARDAALSWAECRGALWSLSLTDGSEISAAFVIDATGRAARLGRRLTTRRRFDRLVAATSTLRQEDPMVEPTRATLIEAVADGWWYASLLRDGRLSIAYFSDPDLLPRRLSSDVSPWRALIEKTDYISRWLAETGFAVRMPPKLFGAGTTCLDTAGGVSGTGAGWAAAGDAAAAFDPLSSHGITTALWTGMRAGFAAADWLSGDRVPMQDYVAAVKSGFAAYLEHHGSYYSAERRFHGGRFWTRRRNTLASVAIA